MRARKREVVLETPRFDVIREVTFCQGKPTEHWYIEKPDAVLVILHNGGDVCMLKAARDGIEGVSYELPGGRIDEGESALDAARRELLEETGLTGTSWSLLGTTKPLPSVTAETVHIFAAEYHGQIAQPDLDAGEDIREVAFHSPGALRALFRRQEIACSVDAYALVLFLETQADGGSDNGARD